MSEYQATRPRRRPAGGAALGHPQQRTRGPGTPIAPLWPVSCCQNDRSEVSNGPDGPAAAGAFDSPQRRQRGDQRQASPAEGLPVRDHRHRQVGCPRPGSPQGCRRHLAAAAGRHRPPRTIVFVTSSLTATQTSSVTPPRTPQSSMRSASARRAVRTPRRCTVIRSSKVRSPGLLGRRAHDPTPVHEQPGGRGVRSSPIRSTKATGRPTTAVQPLQ